jgi:hypothetical protein
MRFGLAALITAAAFAAVSCSSTTVRSDFDHQADFESYSTFAWYSTEKKDPRPTTGVNQIVDGRIRKAMADNFLAKGYSQAAADAADLHVAYYTSLSSRLRVSTFGWGYGWGGGPYWGFGYGFWPGWSSTSVSTYNEGTIIVDVIDREKNQLVWRGVVTSTLSKKSSTEEKIHDAMSRVLASFPSR